MSDASHSQRSGPIGVEATETRAPYKGLTPYAEQDAGFFFGREAEREIIIANLLASRITLLYGASGVGKSSLLQAGVVHDLLTSAKHSLAVRGVPDYLPVFFNNWSEEPVTGIIGCIRQSARRLLGRQPAEPEIDPPTLAAAIEGWSGRLDADLLIIFDQFEEYFLYHPHEDHEGDFAVQFSRAATSLDLRVSFLLAMREDALAMLDRFKGRIPDLFQNNLRIHHLDRQAARQAIERPLEQFNQHDARLGEEPVVAEPELVESVLDEIQIGKVTLEAVGRGTVQALSDPPSPGRHIETPYLQLVMTRLWDEEQRVGSRILRAATLRSLGGAQRIVRTHLDQAMQTLSPDAQDIAARVFHHLVTPSGSKIGHTAPDLADYTALPEAKITPVLRELSRGDARVLRPLAPLGDPEHPRYEIFHDVLAPAILDWRARHLERQAAQAEVAARLQRAAEERQAAQQRAQAYRRKARNRGIALAVALLLVFVVATAGVVAVRAADNARRARTVARSVQLSASALAQLPVDPASSIRLATESLAARPSQEAELALRRALAESRVRVVLHGHTDFVTSAVFSADGAYSVTAGNDRTVRIWSTQTGGQVAEVRLPALSNALSPPQFSADGRVVLITGGDGRARVWGWRSSGEPTALAGAPDITSATFAADHQHVVTGHADGAIRVWDVRTGRLVRTLAGSGPDARVSTIVCDVRDRVAAGSDNGWVRIWSWRGPRGSSGPLVLKGHRRPVNIVAFSSDGSKLLTGGDDGKALVWSGARFARRLILDPHDGPVGGASFSHDGELVLTAAQKTAHVWKAATGQSLAIMQARSGQVLGATFSPDGSLVATSSTDGTPRVWGARTGNLLFELHGHAGTIFDAQFSPDGKRLITAGADGTARVWDVSTGLVLQAGAAVNNASFSPDGQRIVTAGSDATARIWSAGTGRQLTSPLRHRAPLANAEFSRDGRLVVTASMDGTARVWDNQGRQLVQLDVGASVDSAAFSSDGTLVVTTALGDAGPTIWDWNARTHRPPFRLAPSSDLLTTQTAVTGTFSPDAESRFVLTANLDKTARLWDASTGRLIRSFIGHSDSVYSAVFSKDGTFVVTASGDGTVRIWETMTARLVRTLAGQSRTGFRSATLSPDGHLVVAGGEDAVTHVWDAATGHLLGLLDRHADAINSAVFSPTGDRLLTASDDRTAMAYPCETCGSLDELLRTARQRLGDHPSG